MLDFFTKLFDADFATRWSGGCNGWNQGLALFHNICDIAIFLAYLAIPLFLLYLIKQKQREIPFQWIFVAFAGFIFFCGFGHLIEAICSFYPIYRFLGLIKLITAISSIVTFFGCIHLIPKILVLKTPSEVQIQVRTAVEEHQALLKELHHRVKNKMQMVISLLSLQAKHAPKEAAETLIEAQDRIRSLSLIHEHLYKDAISADYIDFYDYFNDLARLVLQKSGITYEVKSSKVIIVGIDSAVPCGIISTEVLTNCRKHAFKNRKPGHVSISIDLDDDDIITLTISDNGVGLPADINTDEPTTFGMKIISTLNKQFDGEIKYNSSPAGTTVTIKFKRKPNNARIPDKD